ncbi:MAG: hypothetical protein AAGF54_14060 [Pseudomonadota bacterium]
MKSNTVLQFLNRSFEPKYTVWVSITISFFVLLLLAFSRENLNLWDFNVYVTAKNALLESGSPYFERESLRFIYPPSSIPLLYLISDSELYKTLYFSIIGALWLSIPVFFSRTIVQWVAATSIFLFVFGNHGYITLFTGNLAPLLYFVAAAVSLAFWMDKVSISTFVLVILAISLVKPFYLEFLIFVWFKRDFLSFFLASLISTAGFFSINAVFYPELFSQFVHALKVDRYDSEIFGITLFSYLTSFGLSSFIGLFLQLLCIGVLFILFIQRAPGMTTTQQFSALFILAVFINPKHISYDLMVAVPPIVFMLLQSPKRTALLGFLVLTVVSVFDMGIAKELYFQWWLGYLGVLLIVLLSNSLQIRYQDLPRAVIWPANQRSITKP